MAKISMAGFDDLDKLFGKLMAPEEMAIKAVNKAASVVEKNMKAEIKAAANRVDGKGRPYSTGELAASVSATTARENEYGVFAAIRPTGTDSRGTRNAEKLAYLEYGVASHGQEPRPVRQKVVNASQGECTKIMQDVVAEEVDKM